MKEIGGYFELEQYNGSEYYPHALAVNCGRNAAVMLAVLRDYKKIYLPDFMCSSVKQALIDHNIDYEIYSVSDDLNPFFDKSLSDNEAIYIVNYYGQLRDKITEYKQKWKNVIFDNAQDFFYSSDIVDCIYTCRKFFGVADGGYVTLSSYCNTQEYNKLPIDFSFDRMRFVLGRFEKNASEFYKEASDDNHIFIGQPILKMSKLTHNLMRSIDYESVKRIRTDNFSCLHNRLSAINEFRAIKLIDGAFMYPLRIKQGNDLRKELQQRKIYVPKLWPDVEHMGIANKLADEIVPLPCDQRYTIDDMEYIADQIYSILG